MRLRRDARRGRVRPGGGGRPKPPPSQWMVFWAIALAASLGASAAADQRIGAVVQRHYNGATGVLPTAGSRDLLFDYDVFAGETVKTPPDGSTVIRFQDKTQIQVGGNSSLVIDRMSMTQAPARPTWRCASAPGSFASSAANSRTRR